MMRSLWTAASGMTSQQTAVDVIANNLANVNTTGYKTQSAQFKTLLYQTSQSVTTSANGDTKPVGAQVGLGVRNSAISTIFTQGNITSTELDTDFAIDGKGFFQLEDENGDILYTRNGSFTWSPMNDGTMMLCSSEGYGVLDTTGLPITLDDTYNMSKVTIDKDGNICYPGDNGQAEKIGIKSLEGFTEAFAAFGGRKKENCRRRKDQKVLIWQLMHRENRFWKRTVRILRNQHFVRDIWKQPM